MPINVSIPSAVSSNYRMLRSARHSLQCTLDFASPFPTLHHHHHHHHGACGYDLHSCVNLTDQHKRSC